MADYEVFCVCRGLCHPAGGTWGLVGCLAGGGRGSRNGEGGKGREGGPEEGERRKGEREGGEGVPRKKRQEARHVLSHCITPPLTHPARFSSLQAPPGTTTRHTVSNTMGHLVNHDVILHRSVTAGLSKMKCQNALSGVKSEKKKPTSVSVHMNILH